MGRRLLKINDSAWLYAESHRTPMQVAMLATFSVPEGQPDFVGDLAKARPGHAKQLKPARRN